MSFDEAVALATGRPGQFVQAWDLTGRRGGFVVSIYRVGETGAQQLAQRHVLEAERPAVEQELLGRGLPLATSDHQSDFIWQELPTGLAVYDSKRCALRLDGDVLSLPDGTIYSRQSFSKVVAFADDDYVARGVRGMTTDGEITLLVDFSSSAMSDPTYGRNELLFETEWCGALAHRIATWAGATCENLI